MINIIIKQFNFLNKTYTDFPISIDDTLPPARALSAPLTDNEGNMVERMIFLSPRRVVTRRPAETGASFMGAIDLDREAVEIHCHYLLGEGMAVYQFSGGPRICLGSRILIASRIETSGEENTISVSDSGLRLTLSGDFRSKGFTGFETYEKLLEIDLLTEHDINRVRAVQTRLATLVEKSRVAGLIKPSFI